jgi:hypothetical protein
MSTVLTAQIRDITVDICDLAERICAFSVDEHVKWQLEDIHYELCGCWAVLSELVDRLSEIEDADEQGNLQTPSEREVTS